MRYRGNVRMVPSKPLSHSPFDQMGLLHLWYTSPSAVMSQRRNWDQNWWAAMTLKEVTAPNELSEWTAKPPWQNDEATFSRCYVCHTLGDLNATSSCQLTQRRRTTTKNVEMMFRSRGQNLSRNVKIVLLFHCLQSPARYARLCNITWKKLLNLHSKFSFVFFWELNH